MPRQTISNCKQVLSLSQMAYDVVRGVMKSYIKTRHQYSAEYPGFWQLLDDIVLRHTQSSIQLRHIHDDWRHQSDTVRGKNVYGCIKFIAEDVCGKERQYCRKHNLPWPPMTVPQSQKYLAANVGAVALEVDTTPGPATTQGGAATLPAAVELAIAVALVIIDPDRVPRSNNSECAAWKWNHAAVRRATLGLRSRNLASLLRGIDPSLPKGRAVRELYGSVREPPADLREPPYWNLMFLDDDALVEAFFNTAQHPLPTIMVVLKRSTEPRQGSPGPLIRSYEASDKEIVPEQLAEVASDSEDDRIPRRFVPPQKASGYIRRAEREHRALQRHIAMSRKLEECAKKWRCADDVVFPHESFWRTGMTAEGHRTLKRKYVSLGHNDDALQVYLDKRLKSKEPVQGVHVDPDGNKIGDPDWEELRQSMVAANGEMPAGTSGDKAGGNNDRAPRSRSRAAGPRRTGKGKEKRGEPRLQRMAGIYIGF